ncbi:MFS transporter [Brevibacillus ginsengisoli]|uniref:MFS transporter n=1 Tax=Brevibacillus ginsengisoli TaxID=363854 RepID=UPI003CF666D6
MSASNKTVYQILFAVSLVHLLNDSLQAVIPALLPILQKNLALQYSQLGLIILVVNVTASILQPVIGYITDQVPRPFLLPIAMLVSGTGMVGIAFATSYHMVLLSVALVGIGSAVFHPEASRVAHMAAGPRRGLAQSIFQVGGNAGQALAPLMTALFFVSFGQMGAAWFTVPAGLAFIVMLFIAYWYSNQHRQSKAKPAPIALTNKSERMMALSLLVLFVSVRSWISAGLQSFYPLFLINVKHYSIDQAQLYTFIFLMAGAIGTFFGGPLADRFGKRNLMIISTLGALPLAVLLPYVQGFWAYPLLFIDGLILLSSFSVTVVYAQELLPGRIGTVSGLIIGLAFGMGGIGASILGTIADHYGLPLVLTICTILPSIGILGFFLPKDSTIRGWERASLQG